MLTRSVILLPKFGGSRSCTQYWVNVAHSTEIASNWCSVTTYHIPTNSFNARTVYCAVELCPLIRSRCHICLVYQCCRSINCYVDINSVRGVRPKALPWTSLSSKCATNYRDLRRVNHGGISTSRQRSFIVIPTPKISCTWIPAVLFACGTQSLTTHCGRRRRRRRPLELWGAICKKILKMLIFIKYRDI